MQEAEAAGDGVEAPRIKGEVFGIAFAKVDFRKATSCLGDHVRREVDADRLRTACGGARGDITRPGGDIEHARAGDNAGGVKERCDGADGDLAGERIVVAGLGAPAPALEFLEARCVRGLRRRHG
jgi:hypothetical protein